MKIKKQYDRYRLYYRISIIVMAALIFFITNLFVQNGTIETSMQILIYFVLMKKDKFAIYLKRLKFEELKKERLRKHKEVIDQLAIQKEQLMAPLLEENQQLERSKENNLEKLF